MSDINPEEPLHPRGFFVPKPVVAFPQERRWRVLQRVPACACEGCGSGGCVTWCPCAVLLNATLVLDFLCVPVRGHEGAWTQKAPG